MRDKQQEPVFKNPRIVLFGEITVDEASKCVFEPWMNRDFNVFGWDARPARLEGKQFIYIAPDENSGSGEPRFYLYIGPHGDPRLDRRLGPYHLTDGTPP